MVMNDYPTEANNGPRHSNDFGEVRSWRAILRELAGAIRPQAIPWEVTGIDISSWNGTMDFAVTKSRGISFAAIRAGYSNDVKDSKLDANRNGCDSQGMPFKLYWFCYVGRDYKKHAESFYNHWSSNPGKLHPVLDCETTTLDLTGTLNWIYGAAAEFEDRAQVPVTMYTSPGWWNSHVKRNAWVGFKNLWVAHWTNLANPILPYDWTAWKFWQWSANGNGLGRYYGSLDGDLDMDLNRYAGSLSAFYSEYNITPPLTLEQRVTKLEEMAHTHETDRPDGQ